MTKPATPAYLMQYEDVHSLLSQHLTQWAFTVSLHGDSVQVKRGNVGFVRDLLDKHDYSDVRVSERL